MTVSDERQAHPHKRKLIEVALPLEDINRAATREKSIRNGHPFTLHQWWSRKPLAAARAVIFGQLVDDPSAHVDKFPTQEAQQAERERLFDIIRELVKWENSANQAVLANARKEIWASCDGNPPPILDPFAGGGSIPLEAQRLGLEAHASDLNPVAVLINKALIEIPAKWADKPPVHPSARARMEWRGTEGLAEDVRCYGKWMRDEAERRIGHLYPKAKLDDGTMATVIAWIWARTVTCPNPACGGTMPLVNKFWLGKKKGKERYAHPVPDGSQVRFEIRGPEGSPRDGTVSRTGAECLLCGTLVPLAYIRAEGKVGRMGAQLMAVAAEGPRTRYYLSPTEEHKAAADVPRPADVPDADLPTQALGFRVQGYGMTTWADLFTNRQLIILTTLADLIKEAHDRVLNDSGHQSYADAIALYLAFTVDRLADLSNSLCGWEPGAECPRHVFGRQTIAMLWEYAEGNPFSASSGSLSVLLSGGDRAMLSNGFNFMRPVTGDAHQSDASSALMPGTLISTDPPYYDNIGYSDLSDFFYVWLRRSLGGFFPALSSTLLTPKSDELVADPFRHGSKGKAEVFFEDGFSQVFSRIREGAQNGYPISVFYAFKQIERDTQGEVSTGWETLLEGMLRAGWRVTGTWPMRTENASRLRGQDSNALASSVVLACRPRADDADATDRRGFLTLLRAELPGRLKELQQGNIAPVDLAQAAIGPGMAVFSRHRQITEPDGSPMRVRTALQLINQVLAEVLSEQEGDLDTDSRWCVKWFEQYEWAAGDYGRAETLATALNTSVPGLERAGVLRARAGKVQLLTLADLEDGYDPVKDVRPTMWEAVLHLSRRLELHGIDSTGRLMSQVASVLDLDGVKELAYLLYSICDRKRRPASALIFNSLVTSWPEISSASRGNAGTDEVQMTMADTDD
jgi:putative DNA methylase